MIEPPVWTPAQLKEGSTASIEVFRKRRIEEPLEEYLDAFDRYQSVVEELLESTVDLNQLDAQLIEVVTDPKLLEALRYLAGPPISLDDLKIVADVEVVTPARLKGDLAMAKSIVEIIRNGLDRRRFPWVTAGREPTESERHAAVMASAALMATRRLETSRRTLEKGRQEEEVMAALEVAGLHRVHTRRIQVLGDGPHPGTFCAESMLGQRKADIIVGLWDRRIMAIECKVSNSSTNSVKRLNNDAAAKAEAWRAAFGTVQIVSAAVLSGVYKVRNLEDAQRRGLTIFWSHDIPELINWIAATKPLP